MPIRRRIFLVILVVFLLCDAVSWVASYRIFKTLTPSELKKDLTAERVPVYTTIKADNRTIDQHISLNGTWSYKQTGTELGNYYLPEEDTSQWHTMELPRNWYLEGLNYHGVIWFRRQFTADPTWQSKAIQLKFGGVDYFAHVWLNGQELGQHEGYFEPFAFDITQSIKYEKPNVLVVRVDSPYEPYRQDWPARKKLIKGIFNQDRSRPGGPWTLAGQEFNTGGIWNDVWVEVSSFMTIERTRLAAAWKDPLPDSNTPVMTTTVTILNRSPEAITATVQVTLTPDNFSGDEIILPSRETELAPGLTEVQVTSMINHPALWWTWDRGEPNLYRVQIQVLWNREKAAEYQTRFGFREVRVGEGWTWSLNGRRFFVRGTNYASTQWLSQTDRAWFERDVGLMRAANLNLVRLTAHVEPEEFYDLADEKGLLVWQDFPLQWAYTDEIAFVEEARRQMQTMVLMLYNHPSIALWCIHNESPWATRDLAKFISDYDARQNKRLDEQLSEAATSLDKTRTVELSSGSGDAHIWAGWAEGKWTDYDKLPGQPFVSQFGAQALPGLKMMEKIFEPSELNYRQGETRTRWEFQGFSPRETFDIAGVGRGTPGEGDDQLIEFIRNSQEYQANLLKYAIESYRQAKYNPMQGIIQYMFLDDWPAISMSVLDYDRQPKPGFYALQTAMQPILPGIRMVPLPQDRDGRYWVYPSDTRLGFVITVVNDTWVGYPAARISWQILTLAGKPVEQAAQTVEVKPDEAAQKVLARNLQINPGRYILGVLLQDSNGKELGWNEAYLEFQPPPKPTPTPEANP